MPRKIGDMIKMQQQGHITRTLHFLTAWLLLAAACYGQATSRLSTSFISRGEQALLEIVIPGGSIGARAPSPPKLPQVRGVEMTDIGRGWFPQPQAFSRGVEMVYVFVLTGSDVGRYTIPPVSVTMDGATTLTEPLDFMIFDPDDLKWSEVESNGKLIRYASLFLTLNDKPYENETTPAEIKLFVPNTIAVEDWGIPDFEREGLAAWRFQPASMRPSQLYLLGQPYLAMAYPSTITPTRVGHISIGPAKIRLTMRETIFDPTPQRVFAQVYVDVAKLEMEALPLPPGVPDGFDNAVGSFRLSAKASANEIREGDPLNVDVVVNGRGNLDTLQAPKLSDANGWKVYPTTTGQRGDERRQLAGSVVFHQSIRPLEMKSEIPAFKFVYFDPHEDTYKTLMSDPIPLKMIATIPSAQKPSAVVQAMPVPLERMTDILEVLHPANLTVPTTPAIPGWLGHAAGALIALLLLAKAWWLRYAPALRKNPAREARLRELREISAAKSADDVTFLKAAGAFIERQLGSHHDAALQAILAERDDLCFRDKQPAAALDQKRRGEILRLLRQATTACVMLAMLGFSSTAKGEDRGTSALQAYEAAKYDEAAKLWMEAGPYKDLSADTLYNIANTCFRAGAPGQAALYYRRALDRDPAHSEALQNLRYLERKFGAITVQRPDYQYALAKLPLGTWQAICWTGVWLSGLALLVFPATRPNARLRSYAVGALVVGPLLASAGLLGWHYFPNDARFAPVERQAVIIAEKVALHVDAARTSPEVIDAPLGSLCEVIRESGSWSYIAFATKTRGWIETSFIEKVIPEPHPQAPKFHKPKGDGKSA